MSPILSSGKKMNSIKSVPYFPLDKVNNNGKIAIFVIFPPKKYIMEKWDLWPLLVKFRFFFPYFSIYAFSFFISLMRHKIEATKQPQCFNDQHLQLLTNRRYSVRYCVGTTQKLAFSLSDLSIYLAAIRLVNHCVGSIKSLPPISRPAHPSW